MVCNKYSKNKVRTCTGHTAHKRSIGVALLFLDHGTRRGEGSVSLPGRSLHPGKTRYALYRRLGGPQGLSEQVRKISPPPGLYPRTIQLVASRYTDYASRPTCDKYNTIYVYICMYNMLKIMQLIDAIFNT